MIVVRTSRFFPYLASGQPASYGTSRLSASRPDVAREKSEKPSALCALNFPPYYFLRRVRVVLIEALVVVYPPFPLHLFSDD